MNRLQELEQNRHEFLEMQRKQDERVLATKQLDKRNAVFLMTVWPICWIGISAWLYSSSFQAPLFLAILFGFVFSVPAVILIGFATPGVSLPITENGQPQSNTELTRAVTQIAQIEQYRIMTDLGKPGGGR